MIGYQAFADLCQSSDCDERGHAAHLAAMAYLNHQGPADEHAALYAVLINFLDDPSVKVRAALAYGLLHSSDAPRPIILSLLRDSPVIARAVLQYSPVLVDVDLLPVARTGGTEALLAIVERKALSLRLAAQLIASGEDAIILRLLRRTDIAIGAEVLSALASGKGSDATIRGALLARNDLPATARLALVRRVSESLKACRLVKGSLAPSRLDRLFQDGADTATSVIGEASGGGAKYVEQLVGTDQINTRLLLHAVTSGHVVFFSACLAALAGVSADKVFSLLAGGSRASLVALLSRCGLEPAIGRVLARIVILARTADLADDVAARHYVVTVLTEELLAEYEGDIPVELEQAFTYLSEQNIALARKAARGVMRAFAGTRDGVLSLPEADMPEPMALPAA